MSEESCYTSEEGNESDPVLSGKLLDALQSIARAQFVNERSDHTLQPTALVNELWLRILRSEMSPPANIEEFKVWAAKAIRNILISHARGKNALKRGGNLVRIRIQAGHGSTPNVGLDLLELEEELLLLEKVSFRAARVVELRFYGGMSHAEVARELGISERLSQQSWAMARSWLSLRLQDK